MAASTSLDSTNSYLLTSQLYVQSPATLSIPAGTTIYALPAASGGVAPAVIVEQGATIMAAGTAAAPITMTTILAESALYDATVVTSDSASSRILCFSSSRAGSSIDVARELPGRSRSHELNGEAASCRMPSTLFWYSLQVEGNGRRG